MLEGFTKVGFCPTVLPNESGAYNVVIISRDGLPVIRVMYFDKDAADRFERERQWIYVEISEYGYFDYHRQNGEFIHAWKKIEGVNLQIIPEEIKISIDGLKTDEDE
ncbi:hypothetical protein pEaSNUABM50_00541 [Erwinia phage pEa_SNUABM_50]|uniref:Uncharacterized protein n=4 Tax=Eneladusvirus BF TaxID=2560751 RepID=A0A7L8ZPX6_9CAUD|nr:hypothetical protein FDH34_gp403 [Serratia phage BF]QOI71432.1 hypothetical protein pEaSNUABM12_00515 [Erwinia phage pEa_SNUABM_12]QOI71991.1 hypothetical protein pEaSNUABM47_00542 [Erwinia phage pEa_SNUABM_47]QOI72531.1 hypothetical protein pEaSNUABM50_00541 [Erwinia phage pEa_SNUABM_50]QXO11663.1 hypothetical protein pEaSNUABM19_00552 [Erwinia phage pEa_SNUABM_19]QXO12212.1 hypothetical protein pEaSNUABM44_00551 [Erwinia phage pEa_SNUABM_44]